MTSRLLPLLAVALALGACHARTPTASTATPRYAGLDGALDARADATASLWGTLQAERRATPVAVLPAWIGRPTRLRERDDADSFEQAVSLGPTPRGETHGNVVMVLVPHSAGAADRLVDGSAGVMGKPTEAGIRAEMEAVFPGLAMQVVERPAANGYGPYGLAIGRGAGGARCLYAWQWIEAPPALQAGQSSAPLSLRVRLCRSDVTLEAMAAAVNQLRLVPRFAGQPVEAPRVAMTRAAPRRDRRRTRIAARRDAPERTHRAEVPAYRAASLAQAVPDSSGRRYLGADTAGPAPSYATPSAPMGAGVVRGAPAGLGGPAPATTSGAIFADLPPEAYRGPSGGQTR